MRGDIISQFSGDERDLLIRVDERVEHLTRLLESFVKSTNHDVGEMRECHNKDIADLRALMKAENDKLWAKQAAQDMKINIATGACMFVTFALGIYASTL